MATSRIYIPLLWLALPNSVIEEKCLHFVFLHLQSPTEKCPYNSVIHGALNFVVQYFYNVIIMLLQMQRVLHF